MHTLPSNSGAEHSPVAAFPLGFASDDPIGAIPDLRMIINDFERNRDLQQQRRQKKRPPPQPESPSPSPPGSDSEHHVDDYA